MDTAMQSRALNLPNLFINVMLVAAASQSDNTRSTLP